MAARKRTGILSWDRDEETSSDRIHLRPRQVERTDIQQLRLITLCSGRYCQARLQLQSRKQLSHLHIPVQGSWACSRPSPCCGNPVLIRESHLELDKPLVFCNISFVHISFVACFSLMKKKASDSVIIRPVEDCLVFTRLHCATFWFWFIVFGFRIHIFVNRKS